MDLIRTLKTQHESVLGIVSEIDEALRRRDEIEVRALLTRLQGPLLAHLELEDRQLYPALIVGGQAPEQEQLSVTAKLFAADMLSISDALEDFFRRNRPETLELTKFEPDFREIVAILLERVTAEEKTLYPLYTRLAAAQELAPEHRPEGLRVA